MLQIWSELHRLSGNFPFILNETRATGAICHGTEDPEALIQLRDDGFIRALEL